MVLTAQTSKEVEVAEGKNIAPGQVITPTLLSDSLLSTSNIVLTATISSDEPEPSTNNNEAADEKWVGFECGELWEDSSDDR